MARASCARADDTKPLSAHVSGTNKIPTRRAVLNVELIGSMASPQTEFNSLQGRARAAPASTLSFRNKGRRIADRKAKLSSIAPIQIRRRDDVRRALVAARVLHY